MTPDQQQQYEDLKLRQRLVAERLQRIVDALGNRAIRQHSGVVRDDDAQDEANEWKLREATLRRLEELTDEEEALLRESGILLPKRSEI